MKFHHGIRTFALILSVILTLFTLSGCSYLPEDNSFVTDRSGSPVLNASDTPVNTPSPTPSPSITETVTETISDPPTATKPATPTESETAAATPTSTVTATPDATVAPTQTPSPTDEPYYGLTGKRYSDYKYLRSDNDLRKIDTIILDSISPEMNKQEQIRAIHEWMVKNIQYDTTLRSLHADTALSTGKTICQGYAELFNIFMSELDINSKMITGSAKGESHAWNCVKLEDEWYYVDVTWDDPLVGGHSDYPDGSNLRYTYFLRPLSVFNADHTPDVELPEPSGTSDHFHDEAVANAKSELIRKLQNNIDLGQVENGFVIDGAENINNVIDQMIKSVNAAAVNGIEPFRFTVYYTSGTADSKELSQLILTRLSEAAVHAYSQSVSCSVKMQEQELYGTMTGEITVKH